MVFEQLYSADWIEKKAVSAFLMGISYSVIGIFSAMVLFPSNPSIAAIAFTSLLLVPSLNRLLSIEENKIANKGKENIFRMIGEHWDIIKIYFFLFIGILLVFAFFAVIWPQAATGSVFKQQMGILYGSGSATAAADSAGNAVDVNNANLPPPPSASADSHEFSEFKAIFSNNLIVLMFCLLASLIYGSGAIFILVWNASVWGTIFGHIANVSALAHSSNGFAVFGLMFLAVLPHLVLEAGGYFCGVIGGGILSKATIREKWMSDRFKHIAYDALVFFLISIIILIIAGFVEVYVGKNLIALVGL